MPLALTPSFDVVDARFYRLALPYVNVEKLYTGCRWAEGPAWFAAGRYLVWSDIPNDRMLRFDETDDSVSVFRHPALHSNGNTVDLQGRLVTCEHRSRCVSRTEFDGTRTVLADRYAGKRFNSPNDVVVKRDGSVWFTDPSYGIDSDYEGDAAPPEIGCQRCLSSRSGERRRHPRRHGLRAAQRPRVLPRRVAAVRRRHRSHARRRRPASRASLRGVVERPIA